jgi:hypothetical protein
MASELEKLLTWLRNEFIILKRDLANYVLSKMDKLNDSFGDVAKSQNRIADALEKQKILPLSITHEVKIPEIKVPKPEVTVNIPEIKIPKIELPEIKIPPIKLPTINVPKPEVTVNVQEREDKEEIRLLGQIMKKLDKLPTFDLWDAVGVKHPLPVILVDENSEYYRASGGGGIVMAGGATAGPRQLNNTVFGSGNAKVTTPGTKVQLPDQPCAEVTITANEGNVNTITIGGSNVVGALATRVGTPLGSSSSYTIRIDNLNKIYLDAVTANDGITYTYMA